MKDLTLNIKQVDKALYLNNLEFAQAYNDKVREATTPANELATNDKTFYLGSLSDLNGITYPNMAGYAIDNKTGELTGLFSTYKGFGTQLVFMAILNGATNLDCFDGFLVDFYKSFGFEETKREKNWTEGQPDVVYMTYPTRAFIRQAE